ncbi:MAG: allantoinase [Betaproteobacteria bacterium]|nr:allantoinase [Betaproteobacteria bacterium]
MASNLTNPARSKSAASVVGYPRDLIGYGRHPPQANWPGRAKIALQFVLNYEEGGENHVLHGDPSSEQFLSEIVGAAAYPDRHMSMDSIYEYGSRVGVWRILKEFERRGLPLTVFAVAMYDSDYYGDDLPFFTQVACSDGSLRRHLIVPYTLDANDMRFATPQGFNTAAHFFTYLKDSFDVLYAEGEESPRMMSVGMHCRLLGRPGRIRALQRFLDYVQTHDRVWICRRDAIAKHWIAHHSPA